MGEKLPKPYEFHPRQHGLNEPVLVAYQGRAPSDVINNELGYSDASSAADTRAYLRKVRRHTAEMDNRLTIIDSDSAYHNVDFKDLAMGEEILL